MYQSIDEYLYDSVVYRKILQSRTNYQVIESGGWSFVLVNIPTVVRNIRCVHIITGNHLFVHSLEIEIV